MAVVRTPEGETRYKKPIGSILDTFAEENPEPKRTITPIRLRSIRALIEDKQAAGDTGGVRALTEQFRQEYAQFSIGKTQAEVDAALNDDEAE